MENVVYPYAESIIPVNFVICSLELKPFCLGHYVLLEQINSPFLSTQDDTAVDYSSGIIQFLTCLLICSLTYEESLELFNEPKKLRKTVKLFEKHFRKSLKKEKNWNIYSKIQLFKEYIRYYTEMPIYTEENISNTTPSGMDWKQSMFNTFKNEFGYTDTEILNMSLKRMFREWCVYAEKNGVIKVVNSWEYEQLKNLKR